MAAVTHRCAVLGRPIAHSLSPVIHAAAYRELGLAGWAYTAHDVGEDELAGFIAGCGPEWVGLSCTMPLKRRILDFGEATPRARALGAGNTFVFPRDGRPALVDNTDVAGVAEPLRALGIDGAASALLVGAGATARAGLLALAGLGVRAAVVLARDEGRALASLGPVAGPRGVTLDVRPWAVPGVPRCDVLLSTVPVRLPDAFAAALTPLARVVFDVQYGQGPSPFAAPCAAADTPLLDGLDMLVAQAVGQVELFTGRRCAPGPLERAARAELARRGGG